MVGEGSDAARETGVGGRKGGPCLVTVETSADTPPGRAAKIISAS